MDPEASRTIKLAALGRPFSLGMLYDCRQDSLVPGMTLWDCNDLETDTRERAKPQSNFEIVASESIEDKSSALNVEASLKASFLGGLVEVGGSAKYLNESKTSKNQARVTLKYETTTKFHELSMNHLGRGNVKYPYVFDQGIATHVVTGILYGAKAFFVFDRDVSEKEDHQDIQGNLKVAINAIPGLKIEGEASLKMEDKEKANFEKFSCKFIGDFSLEKNPVSYQDAIEVYQSLPRLLGANGEKAVPMKVWLLPLTMLDSKAAKLVRQISARLVQDSQNVLEDFSELEMRCNDALRTTIAQQFPQIGTKLKHFKEMCSEFKLEFQGTLAKKLPSIRGGGEEEAELAEFLKKRHSSPFNSKDLNEWMDCKEREICLLKSFTNMMKNTKIVPSQNLLNEVIFSAEYVVGFVFTSLGSAEPFLSALSNYLGKTDEPDNPQDGRTHDVEKEQWYDSKEEADEEKQETNKGAPEVQSVRASPPGPRRRSPGLESSPGRFSACFPCFYKLSIKHENRQKISLKKTKKTDNPQDALTHDVEKEQWCASKEVADELRNKAKIFSDFAEANQGNENIKFLAIGLTNETRKGSSIFLYKDGFPVHENFELPSKPETVTVRDINHDSVKLKISPPQFGAENISSYSVEHCVSGEEEWHKQTSEDKEVTVSGLSPNTEYKFRCRAVTPVGFGPANEVSGSLKTLPSPTGEVDPNQLLHHCYCLHKKM